MPLLFQFRVPLKNCRFISTVGGEVTEL